jgi:hypothetical protein
MICKNCGRPVSPSDNVCSHCGIHLEEKTAAKEQDATQQTAAPESLNSVDHTKQSAPTPAKAKGKAPFIILASVITVLLIGGGVALGIFLSKGNDQSSQPTAQESEQRAANPTAEDGGTQTKDNETQITPDQTQTESEQELPAPVQKTTEIVFADLATASSMLAPAIGEDGLPYDYAPEHTLNNDDAKKWTEGVSGNGTGEWVAFGFDKELVVVGMYVKSGNWRSRDLMMENCRFQEIRLSFDDGSETIYLTDPSSRDFMQDNREHGEKLLFSTRHTTKNVSLTAVSVYPGTLYDDLVLTQVEFIIEK